jgi:hypothetical protein
MRRQHGSKARCDGALFGPEDLNIHFGKNLI